MTDPSLSDPARHRGWAQSIVRGTWREKSAWSQTLGRNVDRLTQDFRPRLVAFATGHLGSAEVLTNIRALREQLDLIEARVRALDEAASRPSSSSP